MKKGYLHVAMQKYVHARFDRWHTPGHCGSLQKNDITELGDNLVFPKDYIVMAEKECARILGGKHARFLVSGSSQGIKAAIMAINGDVLTSTVNHPSVFEGLTLSGKKAVLIENEMHCGLPLPLSAQQIEEGLKKNPQVKGVLIASPTYYGICAQKEIADVVHAHGKILMIDGAHGAHLCGVQSLKKFAFNDCADIINLSAHKTLNAYTQSAYLLINNESLLQKTDDALTLLGTTSPSYLFLAQLEQAALDLRDSNQQYSQLLERIKKFKQEIKCYPSQDVTRIVIDARAYNMSGEKLGQLCMNCKIMPEMTDDNYAVFIATPHHRAAHFRRLKKVIIKIQKQMGQKRKEHE